MSRWESRHVNIAFTIRGLHIPVSLFQSTTDTLKDVYSEVSRRSSVVNTYHPEKIKGDIRT